MIQQTGLGMLGFGILNMSACKAAPGTASGVGESGGSPPDLVPFNRFGRMMQEYYVRLVRDVEHRGDQQRAALRTKADAEAYVREARRRIKQCFGPFPEKTPLNARVTGVLERDGYRIEKVIFDSRPGFPVTANLYVPTGRDGRMPAVVGTCGHDRIAKAGAAYQSFCQSLVRQGFVVLIFDPIGQGERLQQLTDQLPLRRGWGTADHLHVGGRMCLTGEFLGSWFNWDGIRALDYLLTRPEVDPAHVGVTGSSGGGTQATWLCGIESRFTMAAPSCFVTTFRRNLENELPVDTEQCPPRALALGLDHADFIAAFAPKPVILIGQEKDFFDVRGLEEAYGRLRHLYRLFDAEQNIGLFIGSGYHSYAQPGREAMYRWFHQVAGKSGPTEEPTLTLEKEEDLWCTPRGLVGEFQPQTVLSLTTEISRTLRAGRGQPRGEALRRALTDALKLPPCKGAPDYRILRDDPSIGRRYPKEFAATYVVETEPGIAAVVYRLTDEKLVSRPPREGSRALLYISHRAADAELCEEPLLAELIKAEPTLPVFVCDLRGIGESQPNTGAQDYLAVYGNDYFYASHGIMFDRPYPAQRTHDILRLIDWLQSCGHREIHLVAKGWGAIPATFGAVLSDAVTQVTLKHALTSYEAVAEADDYKWPLSSLLPGVLRSFDLPDCYLALASKRLRQVEPWGPLA